MLSSNKMTSVTPLAKTLLPGSPPTTYRATQSSRSGSPRRRLSFPKLSSSSSYERSQFSQTDSIDAQVEIPSHQAIPTVIDRASTSESSQRQQAHSLPLSAVKCDPLKVLPKQDLPTNSATDTTRQPPIVNTPLLSDPQKLPILPQTLPQCLSTSSVIVNYPTVSNVIPPIEVETSTCPTALQSGPIPSAIGFPKDRPEVYYHPSLEICPLIQARWEEELRPLLTYELGSLGVTWLPCLRIAAPRDRAVFGPMLIILCTTFDDSRKIARQLNPGRFIRHTYYKRLLRCGIKMAIVLDHEAGSKGAGGHHEAYRTTLPRSEGLRLDIYGSDESHTLNGRRVQIADDASVSATFGGVIQINGQLYGLTVAHPFLPHIGAEYEVTELEPPLIKVPTSIPDCNAADDSESDLDSSDVGSVWSEPQVPQFNTSEHDKNLAADSATPINEPVGVIGDPEYDQLGYIIALKWHYRRWHLQRCFTFPDGQPVQDDAHMASDWALIELSPQFLIKFISLINGNIVSRPWKSSSTSPAVQPGHVFQDNHLRTKSLDQAAYRRQPEAAWTSPTPDPGVYRDHLGCASMVIFTGSNSGVQRGVLDGYFTDIGLSGFSYTTVTIQLSKILKNGDSGSWVFRSGMENRVQGIVGMVIAGGGKFPIAYLLPIEYILWDIDDWMAAANTRSIWQDVSESRRRVGVDDRVSLQERLDQSSPPTTRRISSDATSVNRQRPQRQRPLPKRRQASCR